MVNTEQEIHVFVKVHYSDFSWLLSAIYASPRIEERAILWNNLASIAKSHNLPQVIVGDFNEPLITNDKFGGRSISVNRSLLFKECLDKCNMIDLGFSGLRFNQTNHRDVNDLIQERIDRFFVNPKWYNLYPKAKVTHLNCCHSDHYPILMETHPRPTAFLKDHSNSKVFGCLIQPSRCQLLILGKTPLSYQWPLSVSPKMQRNGTILILGMSLLRKGNYWLELMVFYDLQQLGLHFS